MLEFVEELLRQLRRLEADAIEIVLNGSISDMERYRYMMGRIEGIRFSQEAVKDLLKKNPNAD